MTLRFANHVLDKLIAPGLSTFTQAEIPDLREEFPDGTHWIANLLLSNAFRSSFKGDFGRYVAGFIRRAQHAFVAYHDARDATFKYLDSKQTPDPSYRTYYRALELWENFAIQSSIAMATYISLNGEKLFDKIELPMRPIRRLYELANKIKHLESRDGRGDDEDVNNSVPLWLSNHGLHSFDGLALTFVEAAGELRSISETASILQDARKFVEMAQQEEA